MTARATRIRLRPRRSDAPSLARTLWTYCMIQTPEMRGSGVGRLGVGVEHAGRIDQAGAGIDRGRNAQRLGDLFAAGTMVDRSLGVDGDTAVAADGDRDRERDQLARLGAQVVGLLAGGTQRLIALDRVGAELGDLADTDGELLAIAIPVEHGHRISPDLRGRPGLGPPVHRR